MKIVHLSCVAPPETGGIGRVACEEVERLRAMGHDATLGSLTNLPHAWRYGNAGAITHRALRDFVKGADVVHLHYPFYGTAERVMELRTFGVIKKLALTFHMDAKASGIREILFGAYTHLFQPFVLRAADAILVSSRDYAAHSSMRRYADRAIELPFGVDVERFVPAAERPAWPTIAFVGGMDRAHAFKGVDVLLRALAEIPQAKLLLAGDGDLRPSYEALARDLGLMDRVTFLGRVADEDLPRVYAQATVFAFPSTSYAEAFGLVALEAQASGVPVVASALPGVRTVIDDGKTGILVPPNDIAALAGALRRLLDDTELRARMGGAARDRVLQTFTWEKHMDGLLEIYGKLCASRS